MPCWPLWRAASGGYAHHPETKRWREHLDALRMRHEMLVAEIRLRGYRHQSPVTFRGEISWPEGFVDPPLQQFAILRERYRGKEPGRIPLPRTAQQMWAQHKYSALARDPGLYRTLGRWVATAGNAVLEDLALELTLMLRKPPTSGGLRNALEHLWGYVNQESGPPSATPRFAILTFQAIGKADGAFIKPNVPYRTVGWGS